MFTVCTSNKQSWWPDIHREFPWDSQVYEVCCG